MLLKPQVVLDTNILVRALLKPDSSDGIIFEKLLNGEIILYYSVRMLEELARVLYYPRIFKKYHLSEEIISVFLETITSFAKVVNPQERLTICRDSDDYEILSVASSIKGKDGMFLITAYDDLLVLNGKVKGVQIISPQIYLSLW
jgi:uncharacterized protein